jgi:hypothetical protein
MSMVVLKTLLLAKWDKEAVPGLSVVEGTEAAAFSGLMASPWRGKV